MRAGALTSQRPRAAIALALIVASTAAACSSTTRLRTDAGGDGPHREAPAVEATTGSADAPGLGSIAVAAPETSTAGATATRSGGGAVAPRRAAEPGDAPAPTASATAATGAPLSIGFQTLSEFDASSFGATGSDAGDTKAQVRAIVEHVNARGGIAGRPVEPIFHATDITADSFAVQSEKACTAFTEDHQVFAVVTMHTGGLELLECLAAHGTPIVDQHRETYDQQYFERYPDHLYLSGRMDGSRWGVHYVDGLVDQGFFDASSKLGLIRFDGARFGRIADTTIKPRLASHGIEVAEEVAITFPGGASGLGAVAAELSSTVLRFRTAGVDRVMFVDWSGLLPYFFMPEADSQSYRPRYGLTSVDIPHFLQVNVPAAQLAGAVGVGWMPAEDVDFPQEPGGNPAATTCLDIMDAAGQQLVERTTVTLALGYCDGVFLLQAALHRSRDVSVSGLRAGIESLGDGYASPQTGATMFGPGRHDGPSTVRHLAFSDDCTCFSYVGAPRPVS